MEKCAVRKEPAIGRGLKQLLFENLTDNSISSQSNLLKEIIFVHPSLLEDYEQGALRKELIRAV